MRTNEELLPLALAALDDASAREVLADAVEETGWWDPRMEQWWDEEDLLGPTTFCFGDAVTEPFVRAMAAVLLFGDWTPEERAPHPLAEVIPVAELLERCEAALARLLHPAEVELIDFWPSSVRVHARANVPRHVVAAVEREIDAWLPADITLRMDVGTRTGRR